AVSIAPAISQGTCKPSGTSAATTVMCLPWVRGTEPLARWSGGGRAGAQPERRVRDVWVPLSSTKTNRAGSRVATAVRHPRPGAALLVALGTAATDLLGASSPADGSPATASPRSPGSAAAPAAPPSRRRAPPPWHRAPLPAVHAGSPPGPAHCDAGS